MALLSASIFLAICYSGSGRAQTADQPPPTAAPIGLEKIAAGSTFEESTKIFQRNYSRLRARQRTALAQAAEEFAEELPKADDGKAAPKDAQTAEAAAQRVLTSLRTASDLKTAMTLVLQLRSQLSPPLQSKLTELVDGLALLLDELAQAKLDYRPYLIEKIQKRWDSQTLREKRAMVIEYYSLVNQTLQWPQQPESLFSASPLTVQLFNRFEAQIKKSLRTAEQRFLPERGKLKSDLQAAANSGDLNGEQLQAVTALIRLLDADYGKGFRGMMLCEAERELPPTLVNPAAALCTEFRDELKTLRAQRASELAAFKKQLAALRESHLKNANLTELLAIDVRLHELVYVLRPIQIFAFRLSGAPRPEGALLLDVSDDLYKVRFLQDDYETWLQRERVMLRPSNESPLADWHRSSPPPLDGPGTALTDSDPLLEGDSVFCYDGNTWQAATVLDVSPFGVVIRWDDFADRGHLEPRANLRRGS